MKFHRVILNWSAGIAALAACALLTGCQTIATPSDVVRGKGYQPQNIYTEAAALPKNIRRVVVLPLVCDENNVVMTEGRAALEPVLLSELIKTKKFEVVTPDTAFLKNRAGRADWSSEEFPAAGFLCAVAREFRVRRRVVRPLDGLSRLPAAGRRLAVAARERRYRPHDLGGGRDFRWGRTVGERRRAAAPVAGGARSIRRAG